MREQSYKKEQKNVPFCNMNLIIHSFIHGFMHSFIHSFIFAINQMKEKKKIITFSIGRRRLEFRNTRYVRKAAFCGQHRDSKCSFFCNASFHQASSCTPSRISTDYSSTFVCSQNKLHGYFPRG